MTIEIPREVPRKNLLDLPVVWFRLQEGLVLPLPGLEVRSFPLDNAVPEYPCRGARQDVNALEKRPVLQDAAAGDELPQTLRVNPLPFRTHGEDRLGFGGEIEGFLRLVIVEPVHPVAVVKERRRLPCPVR